MPIVGLPGRYVCLTIQEPLYPRQRAPSAESQPYQREGGRVHRAACRFEAIASEMMGARAASTVYHCVCGGRSGLGDHSR